MCPPSTRHQQQAEALRRSLRQRKQQQRTKADSKPVADKKAVPPAPAPRPKG